MFFLVQGLVRELLRHHLDQVINLVYETLLQVLEIGVACLNIQIEVDLVKFVVRFSFKRAQLRLE